MFVGREQELSILNNLYQDPLFQMVVVYGRRRVGKTTLLSTFATDKPNIFFTAQEVNDYQNLREFSTKIYTFFDLPKSTGAFSSWDDALDFLAEKSRSQRIILIFDEFPYAVSANPALKSIFQKAIDHGFKDSQLFLILCGSHLGFMENEVLGYKSPLFGRRTAQMKLEALDYYDAGKMLSGFSDEDKIKFYACIGGIPHYLNQVKSNESFEKNIKRLFFSTSGYLYNEPMMLLRQELREPAIYNSIIMAIAGGETRLNDISTKIREENSKVNKYLQTLISLQIAQKLYPYGENPQTSRRGIYRLVDNCYDFWYRFVFPFQAEIEGGNGEIVAEQTVFNENLALYIGSPPFEKICLQYLMRKNRNKNLPFLATSLGTWWGTDSQEKKQTDVDVIAANRLAHQMLLGECKWKSNINLAFEVGKLNKKSQLFKEYQEFYYYLFVKSVKPFKANEYNAEIVSITDLFNVES